MYITLIAEILLAFFAVFGLYAAIRLFVTSRPCPGQSGLAVEIRQGTTVAELPLLMDRAAERMLLCGTRRIWALVDGRLAEDAALLNALREWGAQIRFVTYE